MKKSFLTLIAAPLLFVACSNDKSESPSEAAQTQASVQNAPTMTVEPNLTTMPAANAAPVAVAPGTNPPHGQPGHDCAIPVGAPLNSKGDNPAQVQAVTQPVVQPNLNVPPPTPAPQATAPGTNPPHGQPGHDCAIPVGAPLNK